MPQAGVHEKLADIPQTDGLAVDEIFALAGAVVAPGHRPFLAAAGKHPLALLQGEGDLGKALPLPGLGAAEDHVLHLAAPEGFGRLLPQHPPDGVRQVGLAAAVGPHDGGDGVVEGENGLIREGLKPLQFQ